MDKVRERRVLEQGDKIQVHMDSPLEGIPGIVHCVRRDAHGGGGGVLPSCNNLDLKQPKKKQRQLRKYERIETADRSTRRIFRTSN